MPGLLYHTYVLQNGCDSNDATAVLNRHSLTQNERRISKFIDVYSKIGATVQRSEQKVISLNTIQQSMKKISELVRIAAARAVLRGASSVLVLAKTQEVYCSLKS